MKSKRKVFLTLALLLSCGIASAQVTINGNVYGGGKLGDVLNKTVGENTTINNTSVTINNGVIKGSVYGGGKGVESDEKKGLVEGNATVTMVGGQVERSIYGGGELGSVGTFTAFDQVVYPADPEVQGSTAETVNVPKACASGTGLVTVIINGGVVGRIDKAKMPDPEDDDDWGYIFAAGRGEADSITHHKAVALAVANNTYLEINTGSLITASAYGGAENGLVLGNTHVKLKGGQIGVGYYKDADGDHWDNPYTDVMWNTAITAIKNGTFSAYVNPFHECDAFPFGAADGNFYIYDIFADQYESNGGATWGSNGHSFFGNLFGGGSGYYPIAPGVWRRSAGRVNGNTTVDIMGGHVLTSIYGGNEYTDVLGKATVNMSAGTLGVPRDSIQTAQHPVTCYLFGAGMGDRRVWANTWNNVGEAEVNVTGGTIFGSIFGGGEEGHVQGDVKVTVDGANTLVGTLGYSYVDGNVFGGGRGFSGEALTAGAVGGNINIDIKDGTILGSIYGGGRMASAGIEINSPTLPNGQPNSEYGQMQPDEGGVNHGHVTIDISGGTIGNDLESKFHHWARNYGGNVFGGSMGRIEKLNGTTNPLWPQMAKVKSTKVTIREAENKSTIIKGSVYGGSEFGAVTKDTEVDMQGGTVWSDIYGGGYGSVDITKTAKYPYAASEVIDSVLVTPMQRAGLVEGNTKVKVYGGWVKKSVYGGGLLASVGTVVNDTTLAQYKHTNENQTFALSWPYEFIYAENTGKAVVDIHGGRIGLSGKDYMGPWNADGHPYDPTDDHELTTEEIKAAREDNGDIYGGSKGVAGDRYVMAHSANVNNTEVHIMYPTENTATPENYKPDNYVTGFYAKWQDWATYGSLGCLPGAVYGGGENGHVITNTKITLDRGLVGHNIYGGGKGTDVYEVTLYEYTEDPSHPGQYIQGDPYQAFVTSISAGKVYNNTNVTVNGGYVVRNVFGGGNRASVGKGNYAGGPGDYQEAGYGECWTAENATELMGQLDNSGHTYVTIKGGQIGTVDGEKDDLPTGNVFGGCRGEAAPNAPQTLTPRILYYPQFYLGYVNHTHVTIGQTAKATPDGNSPRLYGSVYGGAQDGHVRVGTQVVVNDAEIGNEYKNPTYALNLVGTSDLNHYQWIGRGNVYGSGSGMGQYEDVNGDKQFSYSSGSVTQFTDVIINGGLIHRNVYGGGSLAIVGPPRIRLKYDANHKQSLAKVTVNSAVGVVSDVVGGENYTYGGQVFGGSRGMIERNEETFSTTIYSEVNLGNGAFVPGNVYGGGEFGQVKQCTDVKMNGGTVGVIDYVRKRNTPTTQPFDSIIHVCGGSVFGGGKGAVDRRTLALVKDSTNVTIRGGHVLHNVYGGGEMASVGLREECLNTSGAPHPTSDFNDYMPKQGTTTHADTTGIAMVTIRGGQVGPAPRMEAGYNIPIGLNGVDGYVYGGGKGIGDSSPTATNPFGQYKDLADVNNTIVTVDMTNPADTINNRIWGCVFGGGEDGHVLGDVKVYYVNGLMGTFGTSSYDGNIFGGGCNFRRKNQSAGRVRGNILVEMSGGHLYGSIFGGGSLGGTGIDLNGLIVADEGGETGRKYGNITVRVKGGEVGNKKLIENFTEYSMGDVFGGGKGSSLGLDFEGSDPTTALLLSISKNTNVEISQADPDIPTIIYGSVYGGGEVANVGSCTWDMDETTLDISNVTPIPNTGKATVTVSGGRIGVDKMRMRYELVEGEGNYKLKYNSDLGHVFGGGQGIIADPQDNVNNPPVNGGANRLAEALAIVFNTEVTIKDNAWVKGSVYGGSENGHVWWDTDVKIKGGQIGAGYTETEDLHYAESKFINPLDYFDPLQYDDRVAPDDVDAADALAECYSWPYNPQTNNPFDPVDVKNGTTPSDGKTWFGNVFGGGSGYYPYIKKNDAGQYESHWNPTSGEVKGNTNVEITGGHILTSVYGGCEVTNVGTYDADGNIVAGTGTATVKMSGGTLGVPRDSVHIAQHPVTCYLFGAGKGDQRVYFNTWTNVEKAIVEVTGGTIYGSVFGGGEEGHVLGDVTMNIGQAEGKTTIIGTTGRSHVDGNIFGAGRGFSGDALTAGTVGGNVGVDISGGTMLGSVYGGGRLASVGTYLVPVEDEHYGQLQPGDGHGKITVNISGGTIGNDYEAIYHTNLESHTTGGNVFAGGMGRFTKLNGDITPLWPRLARAKNTELYVSGSAVIKGNVYGGSEYGTVIEDAKVEVSGGEIWRDVYGGGYGSSDATVTTGIVNSPMQLAGRVFGNTDVMVSGGWIKKSVYGGGELASVGTISNDTTSAEYKHTTASQLALSWPYEFIYQNNTGKASIELTGGRVGITGKDVMGPYAYKLKESEYVLVPVDANGNELVDGTQAYKDARLDNGDIYGGGKGIAGAPFWEAHLANVNETEIYIHYDDTCNATPATYKNLKKSCITGAVYGGGENGHVNENASIQIDNGLVGHAVYGGGKGKDTYTVTHRDTEVTLYSLSAGKVFGNTTIEINGGYVVRSVFGGGNMASVGKGNYIGYPIGSSTPEETGTPAGGLCTITINGGQLGMLTPSKPSDSFKDGIPYGSVFGGCRGAVESESDILTSNVAHMSFVNNTQVTIGGTARLYGSVYGGGQDGHVRWNTDVTVEGGEIGVAYGNPVTASSRMGVPASNISSTDLLDGEIGLDDENWTQRGNVYGGGSGISTWEETVSGSTVEHHSLYAGSVMGKADVKIQGGRIHRNVYGGGNLGTIGDNNMETTGDTPTVTVSGTAKVGLGSDVYGSYVVEGEGHNGTDTTLYFSYGGSVFGAGRGLQSDAYKNYCNVESTKVTVSAGRVYGDVYGGGEDGHVLDGTDVRIQGGTIGTRGVSNFDGNVFGGGKGSCHREITGTGNNADTTYYLYPTCGRVGGNTKITMTAGYTKASIYGGGRLALTGVNADGVFPNTDWNVAHHGNTDIDISGGTVGTSATDSLLICDYSVGDVFGSGLGDFDYYQMVDAGRVTNTTIKISGANTVIHGNVVGGGEMASIGWCDVQNVTIGESTYQKSVYRPNTGAANVTIDGGSIGSPLELTYTAASNPGHWTMYEDGQLIHTCTGNVFGAGQGDVDAKCPAWVSMARARTAEVTINGGNIMSFVYGGGEQGAVTGNTQVTVKNGTIGSLVTGGGINAYFGGVFGAGYGSDDPREDNSTANNDSTAIRTALELDYTPAVMAGRVYGDSRVDILGGTILGNVYGGGERAFLGYEGSDTYGNALVNIGKKTRGTGYEGNATFGGNSGVFGGNKFAGTPFGNTEVNIYQTAHTVQNTCPPDPTGGWTPELLEANADTMQYAIKYVFGGGDMSDYNPHEGKTALTHVWQCENTIEDLYGGGNAANIGAITNSYKTHETLIVDGGRMHRVFGGGNGSMVAANIFGNANTLINGGLIDQVFGGSNNTGTIDSINLVISDESNGCAKYIHEVFGGSSAADGWGEVTFNLTCGQSTSGVSTIYGGSEHAEIIGNLTVNIMGGDVEYVFAGSKGTVERPGNVMRYPTRQQILDAPSGTYPNSMIMYLAEQAAQGNDLYGTGDYPTLQQIQDSISGLYPNGMIIYLATEDINGNTLYGTGGNVTLNLYGGTISKAAFGGNDFSGRIEGKITVNVIDTVQHCPLYLEDLYGAGRSAAYEPIDPSIVSPEINVIHGTVHGTVYGGGQGASAVVKANPVVNIGYNPSTMANIVAPLAPDFNPDGSEAYVLKNVYGGGNRASVEGNPNVNVMENASTNKTIIGTLNTDGSPVSGTGNIFGGGQGLNTSISYAQVQGSNTVKIKSGKVYGNVFGGGQLASVTGNTLVEVTGGEIGVMTARMNGENPVLHPDYGIQMYDLSGGRVYGGGQGNALDKNFGRVQGNTNVNVSGTALIHNNVYGGGELGSVGNGNLSDKNSGVAKVVVTGGEIGPLDGSGLNAYIYGGGRGRDNEADANNLYKDFANVDSTSVIVSDSARIYGSIFGGGSDGHVLGSVHILVDKLNNNIKPVIGTNGLTSWDGNIFGGGRNYLASNTAAGRVGGNILIEMRGGMLYGSVFGGGRLGNTGVGADGVDANYVAPTDKGFITVDISGGEVGRAVDNATVGHVFGGGKGIVSDDSQIWPDLGLATGTKVIIRDQARIYGSVYGGGETAPVMRNDSVFIKGGEIGYQYGTVGTDSYVQKGSVFGGGRGSESRSRVNIYHIPAYNMAGRCTGNTYVKIEGGQIHNNVYGGGELASVGDTTNTNYNSTQTGYARVVMTGGRVGTDNVTQTSGNEGNVYGGGLGKTGRDEKHFSNVDRTLVEISDNAYITSSVFGGSQNGHVLGDANVNVSGGTIGRRLTLRERLVDERNNHLSIFTGNVYGGGRGAEKDASGKYSNKAGHVKGNTNVTINGGVVRHNVYGGGSLASVGDFIVEGGALIGCAPNTGLTTVTITGNDTKHAHIGPTLEDLTYTPTGAEVTELSAYFTQVYGTTITFDPVHAVDTAFKYLGGNEGSVYGSSRGLVDEIYFDTMAYINNSSVTVSGTAQVVSGVFGGGENGHVLGNTDVRIAGGVIGAVPLHGTATSTEYQITTGPYAGTTVKLKAQDGELVEDEYGAGRRVFRGSVFGGGRGTDTYIDNTYNPPVRFRPKAGLVHGNTKVTITDGTIYNRVYGGGTIASVGSFTYDDVVKDSIVGVAAGTGKAEVIVSGGVIGTRGGILGTDGENNGDVFGGGLGVAAAPGEQLSYLAYVGSTDVTINEGATIMSSVYGGSASGHVQGNTKVTVKGGTIGYTYDDNGTTKVHGKWHSNVYGGGGGADRVTGGSNHLSISSGRVFGDTEVNIEGGTIYHNVYGGGSIASVGTYDLRVGATTPYLSGGHAVVNITGGTIGYDGDNNGMVFGSARGEADAPGAFMDSLSYVAFSEVNIGETGTNGPKVKGSVYGSGENGHVYKKAIVNVYSGTIGCTATEYENMTQAQLAKFPLRGNVYGAGCGTDTYLDGAVAKYNPLGGIVQGETEVNIHGGYISRNVYGGGALASVGAFSLGEKHDDASSEAIYSWPYVLTIADNVTEHTGRAVVNVRGGHIGTVVAPQATTGNVFGSSRGMVGDRYEMAPFANVRNASVNVDFTPDENNCIVGSVFGSGESGHVYEDTYVVVDNGLITGSVFGAGDGTETYEDQLWDDNGTPNDPSDDTPYNAYVRSITAGKVYGNTNVTINGGIIQHNVYGGGNLASVGKGNYNGYGEKGTISDGVTTVTVNGGTIGTNGYFAEDEAGVLNGFVFGSSRGVTYPNMKATPRYKYSRDFFLGYVNQSNVVIGSTTTSPVVKGSVFGGGDNGHVRQNTDVTVNNGEIGTTYAPASGETITDDKWKYRGNVYGAGRGVDLIPGTNEYCTSAGSVTINTTVTVNGGTIHRNVYGGGSLATVGPPLSYPGESLTTVNINGGTIGDATGVASHYGGSVYGSGRGEIAAPGHDFDDMATVKESVVNIGKKTGDDLSGTGLVNGSVYGSGENGHVNTNATINIYSGNIGDYTDEAAQGNEYCGNVFGAGSGTETYNEGGVDKYNPVAGIVKGNTEIKIEGGWVMRSVFGGGEMASVGTIDNDTTLAQYKHTDPNAEFALSWPYEFTYTSGTGRATVNVTGGRIGITGKDADMDNGDIYGGGKGIAGPAYETAHFGNVKETYIDVDYPTSNTATPLNYKTLTEQCITGSIYGGSENGHVNEDTHITFKNGLVGHAIYGGGKGKGKYKPTPESAETYSLTAGKVYGNTHVTVSDGYVLRFVFGGGNLASVGKGNYAGYGEIDGGGANAWADTLNSGHTYVAVTGGQLGILNPDEPDKAFKDNNPYGTVFGGCRGQVVADVIDRFGYVNNTHVTIGAPGNTGPRIYGSVFGGSQDGHVRWNANITVESGVIGAQFGTDVVATDPSINDNYSDMNWRSRGNVFGGGSGYNPIPSEIPGPPQRNPNAGLVSCNTKVVINGGTIYHDVFGGGNMSVVGKFSEQDPHPEATEGHTRVFINGGTIGDTYGATHMYGGNVFGGANQGYVEQERVVTVNGGTVEGDVFGGSNMEAEGKVFTSLKTVNIRGGHIKRGVYGCGHQASEGDPDDPTSPYKWTGFVNITGGTIDDEVFAAGNGGTVSGSLCVNIGKEAVLRAPAYVNFSDPSSGKANRFYNVKEDGTTYSDANLPIGKLIIRGDVYGGSHHYGDSYAPNWGKYDVSGFSVVFADGKDYNTESSNENADNYMYIGRSIFGSGKQCESGRIGRAIVIKDYGKRTPKGGTGADKDEMTDATRSLNTIQRGGIVVLDHTNMHLSGARPISRPDYATKYGVAKADLGFYFINGSGIVLGAADDPVYIDSVKLVKSMYMPDGELVYDNIMGGSAQSNWETVGITDNVETASLYRLTNTGTTETPEITPVALTAAQENVIIFNDESKMWVRYSTNNQTKYGELLGFFRMRGDYYDPHGTESFAYARPKIINYSSLNDENRPDGGFLSYETTYNYFTDGGDLYTNTNQHPYTNVLEYSKGDRQDYRMWVGPQRNAKFWYVDGRENGWGNDSKTKATDKAGLYPDTPKKTLFGMNGTEGIGVVTEKYTTTDLRQYNYSYEQDQVFVVGALSEFDEAVLCDSINGQGHHRPDYPLKLFRYPGGHAMSNGVVDNNNGTTTVQPTWGATGNVGPGPNYGAMLEVRGAQGENPGRHITMQGVVMDGLYGFTEEDRKNYQIPTFFDPTKVSEPLIVTQKGSTLSLSDSTVLMRGYNKTDAAAWYTNPDYLAYTSAGAIHHGAALFVDTTATVNVKGKLFITGNKQKKGEDIIESNVYLPTFNSHLYINGALHEDAEIGVTSPRRNKEASYLDNTLSPVAELVTGIAATVAEDAWSHNNFIDEQDWFFGNGRKSTYYRGPATKNDNTNPTLSFGWTWANVVRTQPTGFSYDNVDSPEDLAWLISQSVGMNGETATNFYGKNIKQTKDIDLGQYVWVPVGDSIFGSTDHLPFMGSYDGQGHLISKLSVAFIGKGDHRYERQQYGMFGYVKKGSVNRTFLVNSYVAPEISLNTSDDILNIGGLIGCLEDGTVSNSEAAVSINCPNKAGTGIVTGGLVGLMMSGEIQSSMAMPWITTLNAFTGPVGGLVGFASTGNIYNSFVNGEFSLDGAPTAGGLLGINMAADMQNCYVNWGGSTAPSSTVFKSIVNDADSDAHIKYCYDKKDAIEAGVNGKLIKEFTPTGSSDMLGYMYKDNVVGVGADSTLFKQLNRWVDSTNNANHNHTYARWARPGLSEINGDLPVLLLNEYDVLSGGVAVSHQGSFRSLGTYADTRALQYGGPVRDGNEFNAALTRTLQKDNDGHDIPEYLFVYGDVINVGDNLTINRSKVSIFEDAAVINPGSLNNFDNTYVGVTFDNSHTNGFALSSGGMNYMDEKPLPRDWHMFSSPLSNAPLGFDYKGDNVANSSHINNPWTTPNGEFSWLEQAGSDECGSEADYRYWMKDFNPDIQSTDGYFPSRRGGLFDGHVNELFAPESDECPVNDKYRYPYGMDLYTWTEPDYHWINFKRNGPNHWHTDDHQGIHDQINYVPVYGAPAKVNENELIVGRGYMASIATETFMQSHGKLNVGDKTIMLTNTTSSLVQGWNLVGNPYHGYLDFNLVGASDGPNKDVLSHHENIETGKDEGAFYVIYDADQFKNHDANTAFRYYPVDGSIGGDYASRYLHPHQGFYVKTEKQNGGNLTFTESMLVNRRELEVAGASGDFRGEPQSAYPLVNLYLNSDHGCADVTVIEFERPEWGGARKMKELRVGDGLFYAHHDQGYYAALFAQEGVDRVPLWFEAKDDDIFTMKWNLANADFHSMYLIDNIAGVEYDMLKNNTYSFEGHTDDYPSRFLIVFDLTSVEEQEDDEDHNFAFYNGSEWVVTGDGDLQFIDALGQILAEKHISGQTRIFLPQVADGPYLFRLINGKETKIQKVIITK